MTKPLHMPIDRHPPCRSFIEIISERDAAIGDALDRFTYGLGLFRAFDEANESFVRRISHEHPERADDLNAILDRPGPWTDQLNGFRRLVDRMITRRADDRAMVAPWVHA